MQKHLPPKTTIPVALAVMDLFQKLVEENHLERFAEEHPRDFYRFAARVMPYYIQYLSAESPNNTTHPRSYMRLADGTEIDF